MPFTTELNYFFLYLRHHIEQTHGVRCHRADQRFTTKPVREKTNDHIRATDFLIADCTGNNPNVLYELGIAHALEKDVILITQDSTREAPSDIRLFEFIKYDLARHQEFLEKLNGAIRDVLDSRYDRLYDQAVRLFDQYKQEANPSAQQVVKEDFVAAVKAADQGEGMPPPNEVFAFVSFLLPMIVRDSGEVTYMSSINDWASKLQ